MKSTHLHHAKWLAAAAAAMTLTQSVPAAATPGMDGEKERHKVKDIHELDESAPHDMSGKVQFIPNARAAAHVKAQKHQGQRIAAADKHAGGHKARAHKVHAARHAKKTPHAGKKHAAHAHKAAHAGHKHPGRKHKNRMKK